MEEAAPVEEETVEAAPVEEEKPRRRRRRRAPQREEEEVVVKAAEETEDLDTLQIDLVAEEEEEDEFEGEEEDDFLARMNSPKEMVRLFFNLGAMKLRNEKRALELLLDLAGLDDEDFGEISLHRKFSYVEVREDMVEDVIAAVGGQSYKGITLKIEHARQ